MTVAQLVKLSLIKNRLELVRGPLFGVSVTLFASLTPGCVCSGLYVCVCSGLGVCVCVQFWVCVCSNLCVRVQVLMCVFRSGCVCSGLGVCVLVWVCVCSGVQKIR